MRSFVARHQAPVWLVAILGVIVLVSLSPIGDSFKVTLTEMFIRVIVVVGLYVFIGNSGIISFGQVGFMCIGAYAAAGSGLLFGLAPAVMLVVLLRRPSVREQLA